jgi:Fe-S cluster assembly iron-binding protein IscA
MYAAAAVLVSALLVAGNQGAMLKITPDAGMAIARLAAAQGAPADGGLRIETLSAGDRDPALAMSVAAMPDQTDQVITEETTGARVMLDPLTAEFVDDQILDVDDTVDSAARFRLKPRINGS